MLRFAQRYAAGLAAIFVLFSVTGCRRHPYDNPITKDTQQPDKVLYDRAIDDLEHGRYERARLTLQTLMNTYDTSEFLAKAKLAVADSWYREGGGNGFAQAEAEYKDFILFYPQMEEAAEAQEKICKMQYQQMDKSDRDPAHALRAEDECRQLLQQFPNSKFAPEAQQLLRNIQEVLADAEYKVGMFYRTKGSIYASANRLQGVSDQFPLYSKVDDALWSLAEEYQKMGDRFDNKQAEAYTKIVRDYPLSSHVDEAKSRLEAMKRPIPEPDPVAYSRMKYEQENRTKRGLMSKIWGPFGGHPNTNDAAKSGTPQMTGLRPTIPASVPAYAAGTQGTSSDVTAVAPSDPNVLNTQPDARLGANQPGQNGSTAAPAAGSTAAPAAGSTAPGTAPNPSATPGAGATPPSNAAANASTNPQPQSTQNSKPGKKQKVKKPKKNDKKQQQTPADKPTSDTGKQ